MTNYLIWLFRPVLEPSVFLPVGFTALLLVSVYKISRRARCTLSSRTNSEIFLTPSNPLLLFLSDCAAGSRGCCLMGECTMWTTTPKPQPGRDHCHRGTPRAFWVLCVCVCVCLRVFCMNILSRFTLQYHFQRK